MQGYSQMRLTHYPSITPFIHEFFQGKDPETSLGPHWEQPGRSILDNHLLDLPKATDVVPDAFQDAEFIYYTGAFESTQPLWMVIRRIELRISAGFVSWDR